MKKQFLIIFSFLICCGLMAQEVKSNQTKSISPEIELAKTKMVSPVKDANYISSKKAKMIADIKGKLQSLDPSNLTKKAYYESELKKLLSVNPVEK